ncbi:hypothetical protein KN198_11290 [Ralstonia solanacearum]|nr:hypothetical protein KN198_11290 [Ralstonia solanacearum]
MKVDLPPMFGPVISSSLRVSWSTQSLATNCSTCCSTTGWRARISSMPGASVSAGRDHDSAWARSASVASTSACASAAAMRLSTGRCGSSFCSRSSYRYFSRDRARSWAESALSSNAFSSGVM